MTIVAKSVVGKSATWKVVHLTA